MAIMKPRDSILVPLGTLKILHTKQSLGVSSHTISGWNFWNPTARCETLHKQSMGKDFSLAWYYSEQELVATIKWRQLSEEEKKNLTFMEMQESLYKAMQKEAERKSQSLSEQDWHSIWSRSASLREVSDHAADAMAFIQLSKRGK